MADDKLRLMTTRVKPYWSCSASPGIRVTPVRLRR